MKVRHLSIFIMLLLLCCSKEYNSNLESAGQNNIVAATDTAKIPLNDLRKRTFMGDTGGLYPGGTNLPSGVYADDLLAASESIVPLDTFGKASANGKILFISVGASTGGHNMKMLQLKTAGNPATNPQLKLITCNNGSGEASLNNIMDINNSYWSHITQVINGTKSSFRQVQLLYLETDDSNKNITWPFRPNLIRSDLKSCLRVFKQKFPNLKIVYVLGRTKTFNIGTPWNTEPSPYYFGWGCKWAIEDQINGAPGTAYKGSNVVAPILTWGFYQWANGIPRKTDGFSWTSTQTADGLHATPEGQDTLATRFQNFLFTDKYASTWYAAH